MEKRNDEKKSPATVCPNCGGQLNIDGLQDAIECPYCGTRFTASNIFNESDAIRIEKIKSQTAQKMESEKTKQNIEAEKRNDEKSNLENFKKSKFMKVLIVIIIISLLMCANGFKNGKILAGIVGLISAVLFIVAFLMGMQVIREKKRNFRLIPTILAFVLMIPFFAFYNANSYSYDKSEKFNWSDIELGKYLPQPPAYKGVIHSNTGAELWLDINDISGKQYKTYIDDCKGKGFTVDADTNSISYDAYNQSGYKLDLSYNETNKKISIRFDAPMKMSKFQWPSSDVAKLLPVPKSSIGNISWEHSDGFLIYVGSTPVSDYNEYVTACSDKGFNVDYNKGDDFYYADNAGGYHLSLNYQGNNIMSIRIEKSSTDKSSAKNNDSTSSADSTSNTENPASNTTKTPTANNGVTPSFKEAMDSYEAFFDEYVAFMKKYAESDNAAGMLADYTKYMIKYTETVKKLDEVDESKLSAADHAYYIEVQARITKKLLEVA